MKARQSAEMLAAARRSDWRRVEELLNGGAASGVASSDGTSVLMMAARQGNTGLCGKLLHSRANADAQDKTARSTAMMHACRHRAGAGLQVLETLLSHRASMEVRDAAGRSALMVAAEAGSIEAVGLLLDHRADVNAAAALHPGVPSPQNVGLKSRRAVNTYVLGHDGNAMDGYMHHCRRVQAEHDELQQALEERGLPNNRAGTEDGERLLIRLGSGSGSSSTSSARGEAPDHDQSSEEESSEGSHEDHYFISGYLSKAAPMRPRDMAHHRHYDSTVMEALKNQTAAIRQVKLRPESSGDSALAIAARNGHVDICRLLLARAANAGHQDAMDDSALSFAARCGNVEACRILLESAPPPSPKVLDGALRNAITHGEEAVAEMLHTYDPPLLVPEIQAAA